MEEEYDYEEQHHSTPIMFSIKCTSLHYQSLYHEHGTKVLYDPLDIPGLIISLSECFSPALEPLHFHFEFEFFTFIDERILADLSFAVGFDAVAPLLPFICLTNLRLDWICTSAIDDASLKTIAQSWPQLETFLFGNAAHWDLSTSYIIGMSFCVCQVDINSELFSRTIPNKNITKLSVGMSPIVDSVTVASQLRRFLPKLTYVNFLDWLDDDIPTPPPFEHLEEG
ncbi:hypothetical protein DFJ58DRAFT_746451 [Suillus subalutaceus]|uniref:uncharacterized protein n=1 Tax=Suillus subalutaceus TaxID=48586 RepID=UPI001B8631F2|nr:uncharacterized protein DFJ58DRAFT_746451 [Suillus subalutaceus]KAG1850632.1 hypothetical protein DFJ58DRAFT_746451 [Suillus subalutaceus]